MRRVRFKEGRRLEREAESLGECEMGRDLPGELQRDLAGSYILRLAVMGLVLSQLVTFPGRVGRNTGNQPLPQL